MALPLPKEYLPYPGEPVLPFKLWINVFDNFISLQETNTSDERKNRFLFNLLGLEGIRIFSAHPIADKMATSTHDAFRSAVVTIFQRPVNPFKAYFDFEQRRQTPTETTSEYITALRSLMSDCDFGGRENHHLAIRLVCGCYNKDTQRKLLACPTIDLDEVIRVMQADETALQSSACIGDTKRVHHVQSRKNKPPVHPQSNAAKNITNKDVCYNCGKKGHRSKHPSCPALHKKCLKCGKLGHFSNVCLSKTTQKKEVHAVKKRINGIQKNNAFYITVQIENRNSRVNISAQVDTGAEISGITEQNYKKHFKDLPLLPATTLRNFDNTVISSNTLGRIITTIHYKGQSVSAELHVLPPNCNAVIGQDLIQGLNLQIDGGTLKVHSVRDIKSDIAKKFPSLLSEKMGTFPGYEHVIDVTSDASPSAQKLRPLPLSRRENAEKEIKIMEDLDIWEPVDKSSWVHHMVTVMKPDGNIRVTTDLSPLNNYVIPDRYPLPSIKDLFLELKGAKVFTKLDLRKAFFHIKLSEESRHLTTTITHQGLRQYKRLPMGLKDSASVCQRLVSQTLSGCPGTIAYVDDILIFGSNQQEHDNNLNEVLQRLSEKDFRLQLSKCEFSTSSINFLGHVISLDGITPDPKNVKPIVEAATPHTVKQVQSFLGMVNYYQEFIPNLSTLAEPLRNLTRKNTRFVWSEKCENSFRDLKHAIAGNIKNFIFDPNAPTFVTTDASDVGLGAVLSQIQNGREVPIAHASHTLQPRERNYAVNEKEALACVWACETWDKFLLGRHFTLRTDHAALTTLLRSTTDSRKSSKFLRWIERLSVFDYTMEYRKGDQNVVADALSRLSTFSSKPALDDTENSNMIRTLNADHLSVDIIKQQTQQDQALKKVYHFVQNGWPRKRQVEQELQPFYTLRNEFSTENGYIVRNGDRIVVPPALVKGLLNKAHEGHPGIVRMKRKIRETYWWPGQDTSVEHHVKHCVGCQRSDKSLAPSPVPTNSIPVPDTPWKKLAIDICGPFLIAPQSSKFIVVLMDYHSKFPEVLLTGSVTSSKIIKWLDEIFSRYGAPDSMISDNGPQFTSQEFTNFLMSYNVLHLRTAVYNPQGNGCVERFNRHLKTGIQAFHAQGVEWSAGVQAIIRNYRATSLTPNSKSPAELLFGRKIRLPFEVVRKTDAAASNVTAPSTSASTSTSATSPSTSATSPSLVNLHSRGPYRVGDKVLARRPSVLKGQSPWSAPLTVTQVLGNWTYHLSDGQTWNARKLRRFIDDNVHWTVPGYVQRSSRKSARSNRGVPPARYPYH